MRLAAARSAISSAETGPPDAGASPFMLSPFRVSGNRLAHRARHGGSSGTRDANDSGTARRLDPRFRTRDFPPGPGSAPGAQIDDFHGQSGGPVDDHRSEVASNPQGQETQLRFFSSQL